MAARITLISDFHLGILAGYLRNEETAPLLSVQEAPYGQVHQVLADSQLYDSGLDASVVWTRPQGVITAFSSLASGEHVTAAELLGEVDDFADYLLNFKPKSRYIFVPSWTNVGLYRGMGLLDYRTGVGLTWALAKINLRLAERLGDEPEIYLLDSERWMRAGGPQAYNPRMWLATKVPFSNAVFREAAADIKAAIATTAGLTRKLIVVDLDNTLWGGIVGETGSSGLILGGHSPQGEAFVDFQRALKSLARRGVQLAIASKNDEAVALDALGSHPAMVLRPDDFAGWRIDWQDKASNVASLVEELNLGLSSVVFIDDNAAERGRVREALPEVLVPDWPTDATLFTEALMSLRCFDQAQVSVEDTQRVEMYRAERQRRGARASVASLDDWLDSLDIQVSVEGLAEHNQDRIVQLFNKTNQMNMTTRRLTSSELRTWLDTPSRRLWAFRVVDRFGDMGLTGIVTIEVIADEARIVDFVLSCRVMGRNIEEAMVHTAIRFSHAQGAKTVMAEFLSTERNGPCLEFWRRSGFKEVRTGTFEWGSELGYPYPRWVHLSMLEVSTGSESR